MHKHYILLLLLFGLGACQQAEETQSGGEKEKADLIWMKEQASSFSANIADTASFYSYKLDLRLKPETKEALESLELALTITSPSKRQNSKSFEMPVRKLGVQETSAEGVKVSYYLKTGERFEEVGEYSFVLTPYANEELLKGILSMDFDVIVSNP